METWPVGVEPMLVSNANQLAGVDDVFNAVLMKGDMLGDVVFYGKGAGKLPTASAVVVADVIDALKEGVKIHDSLFWKPAEKPEGQLEDKNSYPWYIRVTGVAAALLPSVAGAGPQSLRKTARPLTSLTRPLPPMWPRSPRKLRCWAAKVALAMKNWKSKEGQGIW